MKENLELWDAVRSPERAHTKEVTIPYKHTDINFTYMVRLATERFGPCGIGWGFSLGEPDCRVIDDGQLLVRVRVTIWYVLDGKRSEPISVDGCKLVIAKFKSGLTVDDEAYKKAASDGIKKALSMLGFCADVFLGEFDAPHSAPAATRPVRPAHGTSKSASGETLPPEQPQPGAPAAPRVTATSEHTITFAGLALFWQGEKAVMVGWPSASRQKGQDEELKVMLPKSQLKEISMTQVGDVGTVRIPRWLVEGDGSADSGKKMLQDIMKRGAKAGDPEPNDLPSENVEQMFPDGEKTPFDEARKPTSTTSAFCPRCKEQAEFVVFADGSAQCANCERTFTMLPASKEGGE